MIFANYYNQPISLSCFPPCLIQSAPPENPQNVRLRRWEVHFVSPLVSDPGKTRGKQLKGGNNSMISVDSDKKNTVGFSRTMLFHHDHFLFPRTV